MSAIDNLRLAGIKVACVAGLAILASSGADAASVAVRASSPVDILAAREVQRYVYLRTGTMLTLATRSGKADIVLTTDPALKPEEYRLRTRDHVLTISGGSDAALLFGAYAYAEILGVRFYLHGDTIPDQKIAFKVPQLDETHAPLFATRGIQPFHDFPEGPDWWSVDDYKAYLAQMAKMRMNFIGLHTYPEGGAGPEPLVWIGLPEDVNDDGTVKFSYPSHFAATNVAKWGYRPAKTGHFAAGAGQLFAGDEYGPAITEGQRPAPTTPEGSNLVFDRSGAFFRDVFTFAHDFGIKVCIGTETPLTIPGAVRKHLEDKGLDPLNPDTVRTLYEGMFKRIVKAYPVDTYWLWTPEEWLEGQDKNQVEATRVDIESVTNALQALGKPFAFATSGWVLGPALDRTLIDKFLPKDSAVSAINQDAGFAFVDPAFSLIQDRPKWVIPWMEDDPGLVGPQLWVGRIRRDAADARSYGADGLIGILWRTKVLAPNLAALERAGWDQKAWNSDVEKSVRIEGEDKRHRDRDLASNDLYADWAQAEFGDPVAKKLAVIFQKIDGGIRNYADPGYSSSQGRPATHIPRPDFWPDFWEGPGAIRPNETPWEREKPQYAFVDDMEALRSLVKGAGERERFDYWLNTFKYLRAMGEIGCTRGQLDKVMAGIVDESDPARRKARAEAEALPLRITLARQWETMMTYLLQTVSTPGELGTVANLEQHTLRATGFIHAYDDTLTVWLRAMLPATIKLSTDYQGAARVIVPTVRTVAMVDEAVTLRVIVLDRELPQSVDVIWRELGHGRFQNAAAKHIGRGVYEAKLPPLGPAGIEYRVEVRPVSGKVLLWPATAPTLNQTVVAMPAT